MHWQPHACDLRRSAQSPRIPNHQRTTQRVNLRMCEALQDNLGTYAGGVSHGDGDDRLRHSRSSQDTDEPRAPAVAGLCRSCCGNFRQCASVLRLPKPARLGESTGSERIHPSVTEKGSPGSHFARSFKRPTPQSIKEPHAPSLHRSPQARRYALHRAISRERASLRSCASSLGCTVRFHPAPPASRPDARPSAIFVDAACGSSSALGVKRSTTTSAVAASVSICCRVTDAALPTTNNIGPLLISIVEALDLAFIPAAGEVSAARPADPAQTGRSSSAIEACAIAPRSSSVSASQSTTSASAENLSIASFKHPKPDPHRNSIDHTTRKTSLGQEHGDLRSRARSSLFQRSVSSINRPCTIWRPPRLVVRPLRRQRRSHHGR